MSEPPPTYWQCPCHYAFASADLNEPGFRASLGAGAEIDKLVEEHLSDLEA